MVLHISSLHLIQYSVWFCEQWLKRITRLYKGFLQTNQTIVSCLLVLFHVRNHFIMHAFKVSVLITEEVLRRVKLHYFAMR